MGTNVSFFDGTNYIFPRTLDDKSFSNYTSDITDVISQSSFLPPRAASHRLETVNNFQEECINNGMSIDKMARPIFALAIDTYPTFLGWFGYKSVDVKIITEEEAKLLYGKVNTTFDRKTIEFLSNRGLNPQFQCKKNNENALVADETKPVIQHQMDNITLFDWPSKLSTFPLNKIYYDTEYQILQSEYKEVKKDDGSVAGAWDSPSETVIGHVSLGQCISEKNNLEFFHKHWHDFLKINHINIEEVSPSEKQKIFDKYTEEYLANGQYYPSSVTKEDVQKRLLEFKEFLRPYAEKHKAQQSI
jgi:hypothetical protein